MCIGWLYGVCSLQYLLQLAQDVLARVHTARKTVMKRFSTYMGMMVFWGVVSYSTGHIGIPSSHPSRCMGCSVIPAPSVPFNMDSASYLYEQRFSATSKVIQVTWWDHHTILVKCPSWVDQPLNLICGTGWEVSSLTLVDVIVGGDPFLMIPFHIYFRLLVSFSSVKILTKTIIDPVRNGLWWISEAGRFIIH